MTLMEITIAFLVIFLGLPIVAYMVMKFGASGLFKAKQRQRQRERKKDA